ncbi:hypothetical protein BSKO_09709 [Bryopsis sp. KO-2023]|nr:hypothetical protein BSKO_09709 [Bryopsis sp. KO-2023]
MSSAIVASSPDSAASGESRSDDPASDKGGRGLQKVVWVQTVEGGLQAIPQEVAFLSPFFQREALHTDKGWNSQTPITLPKQITPVVLDQIVSYCQYHRAPGRSDKERKLYDEKFIRMDACRLCQLTSAADALDLRPLVDLASRALARLISGKTPEEIRATFNLPDDLTEEEKLEPVPFGTDEPRIRLLNRLYAKKRRELAERKAKEARAAQGLPKEVERGPPAEDTRSVDDLLKFIESGGGDEDNATQGASKPQPQPNKPSKKKKKKKSGKRGTDGVLSNDNSSDGSVGVGGLSLPDPQNREFLNELVESLKGVQPLSSQSQNLPAWGKMHRTSSGYSATSTSNHTCNSSLGENPSLLDGSMARRVFDIPDRPVEELFPEEGFEDEVCDLEMDLEVADFARRLESDWSIRLQELISVSSQRPNKGKALGATVAAPTSLPV